MPRFSLAVVALPASGTQLLCGFLEPPVNLLDLFAACTAVGGTVCTREQDFVDSRRGARALTYFVLGLFKRRRGSRALLSRHSIYIYQDFNALRLIHRA